MDEFPEPTPDGGVLPKGEDDARLSRRIEAARGGDTDAFAELAREHAPGLFRFALRLTGRRDEAEDLVQEPLLRAIPAIRRFEGRAKLSTYLLRALSNLWKNRLRSRSRSRLVFGWFSRGSDRDDSPPEPVDAAPSALERMDAEDRAAAVRRAVARIEPTRRLTLLLREVEGLSYEAIAEVTTVPVGTVRSRIARAREDLRRLLGDAP